MFKINSIEYERVVMKSTSKFRCLFITILFWLTILILGCSGSDPVGQNPSLGAPRVQNLQIDPDVICVGSAAEITFEVLDPNQDPITWTIKLNTNIHGSPDKTTGTDVSGSHVDVRFKAATSGRHSHRVTLTVSAADPGGLQAEPASKELFVFNCGRTHF